MRQAEGKTQAEAAAAVGVTQQAVDKWEKEKANNTTSCNASTGSNDRAGPRVFLLA
jgi:DNA-binding XRE family transcriptional regulator